MQMHMWILIFYFIGSIWIVWNLFSAVPLENQYPFHVSFICTFILSFFCVSVCYIYFRVCDCQEHSLNFIFIFLFEDFLSLSKTVYMYIICLHVYIYVSNTMLWTVDALIWKFSLSWKDWAEVTTLFSYINFGRMYGRVVEGSWYIYLC